MCATLIETLASYVPPLIARRLVEDPTPIREPRVDPATGAALLADLSGFTRLTERLMKSNPAGVEQVSQLLNQSFGQLIELIAEHGGEVVKFAGDALLALWPVGVLDEPLAKAARRATQCALAVQSHLHGSDVGQEVALSLRIAVSAGEMTTVHLGGALGRWDYTFAGQPLARLGEAQNLAQPGEVVLGPETAVLLSRATVGQPLESGFFKVEQLRGNLPKRPLTLPTLQPNAETALKAYIPGAIIPRLNLNESSWLAELRTVTVLFINLPNFNRIGTAEVSLAEAQETVKLIQESLYRYEGSINKLSIDDKGASLIGAFGLPPLAHRDDELRGVQAATDIQQLLAPFNIPFKIGVTSGEAFCGLIGSERRREYTMIGNVVNLAARLMQQAELGGILCDDTTYFSTNRDFSFRALAPIRVKGRSRPLAIFEPVGQAGRTEQPQTELVGRQAERHLLTQAVQELVRGESGLIILEGEAGIGKSRLLEALSKTAQSLNLPTLVGASNSIEKYRPYHAWQPIFRQYFELETITRLRATHREGALDRMGLDEEQLRLVPLLNSILPFDFPENEYTAVMTGQIRADNTHALLVTLLQKWQEKRPFLLVIDDLQWLDSASWALLRLVNRDVSPLLIVCATRPLSQPAPPEYRQLLGSAKSDLLHLDLLPPDEALRLVSLRLGVRSLPPELAALIREKAEGHPFFSEEMALALRDAGVLQVENGVCQIAPTANLNALDFPTTIQGVITSRLDRLAPPLQVTLKVASVVGRIFQLRVLEQVHPIKTARPQLPEQLVSLEQLSITQLETPEPELSYIFKHIITQEVAYNLMLYSQRQALHSAVAEWYEQAHEHDLASYYSVLAYHWRRAGVVDKTIDYLEKAGEQALRDGAFEEAVDLLTEAIKQMGQQPELGENGRVLRLARWERQIGRAYFGLGRLQTSREHLYQALMLLDQPVPQENSLIFAIFQQFGRQVALRSLARQPQEGDRGKRAELIEAARAYELLAEIYYFANEALPLVYVSFRTLNLMEAWGVSPELSRAYSTVSITLGAIPLHSLVQLYSESARQIALQVDQIPTSLYTTLLRGVYLVGMAMFDDGMADLEEAIHLARLLGDRVRQSEAMTIRATSAYYRGQYHLNKTRLDEVESLAQLSENRLHLAWGTTGRVGPLLRQGRLDETVAACLLGLEMLAETADRNEEIRCHLTLALAYHFQGLQRQGLLALERGMQLLRPTLYVPAAYHILDGYTAAAELHLRMVQAATDRRQRREWLREARNLCRALRRFAVVFPIGKASALLYGGWFELANGRFGGARRKLQKTIEVGKAMGLPFEVAMAHYLLAQMGVGDEHKAATAQLFAELDAALYFELLERMAE